MHAQRQSRLGRGDQLREDGVTKLVELLKSNPPDALRGRGIYCRVSADRLRMSLSYEQLEADPADEVASACRGLVVASRSAISLDRPVVEPQVVARPFKRFFNMGQPGAAELDLKTARVQHKFDGTLTIAYWFSGTWYVATRSAPDADFERHDGYTYAQCFWRLWGDRDAGLLDVAKTYCFELVGPRNRHVVRHDTDELILLGVIDTQTGEEVDPRPAAQKLGVKDASSDISFTDLALLAELAGAAPADQLEGFVLIDDAFRRVKVKNPAFFVANNAQQLLDRSPRTALIAVLTGTADDALASSILPEHVRAAIADLAVRVKQWCTAADARLATIASGAVTRRDLADAVRQISDDLLRACAFAVIDSRCTATDWLRAQAVAQSVSKRRLNAILEAVGGYHP